MKLCLLAPRFPFPENGGDVLRINSIARYLKSKGNELILISFCFGEIRLKKEYFELYDTIYIVKKQKSTSGTYLFLPDALFISIFPFAVTQKNSFS